MILPPFAALLLSSVAAASASRESSLNRLAEREHPTSLEPVHLVSRSLADSSFLGRRDNDGGYKSKLPKTHNVSFLHINDVHAHLDQFRSSGIDCSFNTTTGLPTTACFGGYARVLTKVKEIRKRVKHSLFLNAGDEFQGTLFYTFYKGWKISETLNQMGFTAFTLGNHEFDGGDELLADFLNNLTFPTISTNVKSTYKPLQKQLKPFLIVPKHDLAIVAVTTESTPDISKPGNGTTFSPVLGVQETVNRLLKGNSKGKSKVKRVVALTHIGYDEDIKLAQNSRNLHLIIGGHSHTPLGNMSYAQGKYPTIVKNLDGEEVFIVTAYRWGQHLGEIEIAFEKDSGKVLATTGTPHILDATVKQDTKFQKQVTEWRKPFDEFGKVVIGRTATDLDQLLCRTQECTLGNAVTDSMLASRAEQVDFAMHNSGGIRATIEAPDITQGSVLTAFPFGNSVVDVSLTGEQIWALFEGVFSKVNSAGVLITSTIQVSKGIEAIHNPNNPIGSRLISLKLNGENLVLSKTYKMATLDFIATGGDAIIANAPKVAPPTLGSQDEVFSAWVKANTPLDVKIEGRIKTTTDTVQLKPAA